jgi:hypothetical protein
MTKYHYRFVVEVTTGEKFDRSEVRDALNTALIGDEFCTMVVGDELQGRGNYEGISLTVTEETV